MRIRLFLGLSLLAASIHVESSDGGVVIRNSNGSNAIFRSLNWSAARPDLEICAVEVQRGKAQLKILDVRAHGSAQRMYEGAVQPNAIALINGGYFGYDQDGDYIPLGLIRIAGQRISPQSRWPAGGLVLIESGQARIESARDYDKGRDASHALQSFPLLLDQGRIVLGETRRTQAARSVIATTATGGMVLLVLADRRGSGVSLRDLVEYLKNYRTQDGEALNNALALDGGSSSHLYLPTLKRHCGAQPYFVPNMLLLE